MSPPIDVFFLILPHTLLLDLAGPAEALRMANRALEQRGRPTAFRLHFAGPRPEAQTSVGLHLGNLEPLPDALPDDAWVVLLGLPGDIRPVLDADPAWLDARDWLSRTVAPRLTSQTAASAATPWTLLTVCVGSIFAADAGLVGTRRVTTHHEDLDLLARRAPAAQVVPNRVFVEDGPLLSSAGVTAGIDLALHAIARVCGEAIAAHVAQGMVVFARRGAQAPEHSPLLAHRDHLHPALHRVQDAVCDDPQTPWPLERLADVAHVSPRHLGRLFARHCGLTPRDYVESVRLAVADHAATHGAPAQTAAAVSGFTSTRQWRRARQRRESPGNAAGWERPSLRSAE